MQKILFRAKKANEEGWSYGDYRESLSSDGRNLYYILERDTFFNPLIIPSTVSMILPLKDKNGNDLFPDDLLRIKGVMGDKGESKYDCIYKVNRLSIEGLSLSFVRLFSSDLDSLENSYPINTTPSFRYGSLCIDYINRNYDRLAIPETWGENENYRQRWKECHYTNDIELIGNIYDNI